MNHSIRVPILIVIFCSVFHFASFALKIVELKDEEQDIYLFKDHLEIAEDTDNKWTIDSITKPGFDKFILNTEAYRYVENHTSTYWIHIKARNLSHSPKKWVFEVLSMHTNDLQLYYKIDGRYVMKQTGEKRPFQQREYKVKNFTFDLPIETGEVQDIYVRVRSMNDAGFEYKIRSQQYFTWYATHEYLYLGVYYGLLIFLIIYNIFLFATSLDKLYLFYVLYLVGCCLVSFSEDGLCFEFLWPNHPGINAFVDRYCEQFFLVFFIIYVSSFISLPKTYPVFSKLLIGTVGIYLMIQVFFVKAAEITYLYMYWLPFMMVYAIVVYSYKKGYKAARFLIIGYSFVLFSILISRLRWYGIIDANIFTVYSFYFAVVIEAFVFTYAISDRFNLLKKEKESTQLNLIAQLEENKQLQTKVNRELEVKVNERTSQLQKEKLDDANKKLEAMAEALNKVNSKLDYDNWHLQKDLKEETKSRILLEKVSYEEYCKIFPTDFSCFKYLEEVKWQEGYICKKCSNTKYSEQKDEHLSRRCSKCGYIESVIANTIFQSIKFPVTKAFYLVYYCSLESEKMTLDELSELLQLRRNTCWGFRKKVQERIESVKQRNKVNYIKNWESLILD